MSFDTSFLIDFQRERARGAGPAHTFLEENMDCVAMLSMTAFGEFAAGFEDLSDPIFRTVVDTFELLTITEEVVAVYARLSRELRKRGRLIGANDRWIAAAGLERGVPVVTRNVEHFARVPGLVVRGY